MAEEILLEKNDEDQETVVSMNNEDQEKVNVVDSVDETDQTVDATAELFSEDRVYDEGATSDDQVSPLTTNEDFLKPLDTTPKKVSILDRPATDEFKEQQSDNSLDNFFNRLRRSINKNEAEDKGAPFRVRKPSGDFEFQLLSKEEEKEETEVDFSSLKNIIEERKDPPEDTENATKAVENFIKTVGAAPRLIGVARETAINVSTKDLPAFLKLLTQAFGFTGVSFLPGVSDVPTEDVLENIISFIKNKKLDVVDLLYGSNSANLRNDFRPIEWRTYPIDGKDLPLHEHVEELDKQLGFTKYFEELNKNLLEGIKIPEKDRNMLEHMVRFGIEIGMPFALFPFRSGLLSLSKGFKHLDNHNISFLKRNFDKNFKGGDIEDLKTAININNSLRKGETVVGLTKNGGAKVRLRNGQIRILSPMNVKNRTLSGKSLGIMRNINMTVGAGVAGGAVYSILMSMPEYKEYAPVAYLASIVGAIKGGSGLLKTATRVPGAASPLGFATDGGFLAAAGFGLVGFTNLAKRKFASSKIAQSAGALMFAISKGGDKLQFLESKWGKFMMAQAAGVSAARALSDVYKNDGRGLDKMIAQERLPEGAYKHLQGYYNSLPEKERLQIRQSLESVTNLSKRLSEDLGAEGMNDHFFMLDQVLNLAVVRSQRQILMSTVKFGKEGFLGKYSSLPMLFGKKRTAAKLLSHMDEYSQIVENQVEGMAKALKNLRNKPAASVQGTEARVRLINIMTNHIDSVLEESNSFRNQIDNYKNRAAEFTGRIDQNGDQFLDTVLTSQPEGGLLLERFSTTGRSQEELVDIDNEIRFESKDIMEEAFNSAKAKSDELYNKITNNPKFQDVLIPINKVIEELSKRTNVNDVIQKLSGRESVRTLREYVITTKQNFLRNEDFENITERAKTVLRLALKNKESFTFRGNTLTDDLIDEIQNKISDLSDIGLTGENTKEDLINLITDFVPVGKQSSDIFNAIVPSVDTLKAISEIKSNFLKKSVSSNFSSSNIRNFDAGENADAFDMALKQDFSESEIKNQLSYQGLSTEDINEYIKLKKIADNNYRDTIGYVWKNKFGDTLRQDPRNFASSQGMIADNENLLRFLTHTDNATSKDVNVFGLEAFNRAFPKSNPLLRQRASEMMVHQLGYMVYNNPKGGLDFVTKINNITIDAFVKEKIIDETIGENLKRAINSFKKGNAPIPEVKKAQERLKNNIDSLIKKSDESVENSWVGRLAKDKDFKQEDFVDDLTRGIGKSERVSKITTAPLIQSIKADIDTLEDSSRFLNDASIEDTENVIKAVDNIAAREIDQTRDANINIFLRFVTDSDDPQKAINIIEDTTDVILNQTYLDAFEFSKFKKTFGMTKPQSYGKLEGEIEKADNFKFNKLRMDVNPEKLAESLSFKKNVLKRLNEAQLELAKKSGNVKLIEEATAKLKMIQQLDDINEALIIVKGQQDSINPMGQPTEFVGSQVLSRVYSWARGVVGIQYLATEAAYKSWHAAHANMMKEILFNPSAVDTLHTIAVSKGKISDVKKTELASIVFKAWTRGDVYSNEETRKEGSRLLVARQKKEIVFDSIDKLYVLLNSVVPIDPNPVSNEPILPEKTENLRDMYIPKNNTYSGSSLRGEK